MEAVTGVANGRVGSLPSSSSAQLKKKEWRAISDHPVRNSSNEELDRMKLAQSEYERRTGTGTGSVDYCSINVDGNLDDELMQQRLHDVSTQREKMQQMEIELRAQIISRQEIIEMQNSFSDQINEHVNAAAKLKDHLQVQEQAIRELELKMEEKDRELRAIKIDNEAAWAKEDLIREQNKELMAYRRESDNYGAERAQQLQQIHDLQEHIQEKERQFVELEEQHRVLQEAILYKDEQIKEAQAWIARMEAMQSTTNHSLQTELRERTEQFSLFWHGCQRQFADMETHHLQTIHQLQLELAEARQRNGMYTEEASVDHKNSEEASSFAQTKGIQVNVNENGTLAGNAGLLPNGNADNYHGYATTGTAADKTEHVPGVPIPSSVIGLGAYIPPGQVTALHPFFIPQQGVPHSVPQTMSHVPEAHMAHFLPMPAMSSQQDWQNHQVMADGSQLSNHNQLQPSQTESSSRGHYDYEQPAEGHITHSGYAVTNSVPNQEVASVVTASQGEAQSEVHPQSQQKQESPSNFYEEARLESSDKNIEMKVQDNVTTKHQSKEGQSLISEKQQPAASPPLSSTTVHQLNPGTIPESNGGGLVSHDVSNPTGRASSFLAPGKVIEPRILDERSLLACIVRAIPAGNGGQIRISSTLPNRLGKMLAPLHWHDYKKKYGKLDDFVAGHPELFVIEGDFIHLREGAQEKISATAAAAKVAAAASAPYSSVLPSVAVTPMAQTHRLKKVPSVDSKAVKIGVSDSVLAPAHTGDKLSQQSTMQNQHQNGVYNIVQGLTNVKILSKPRQQLEPNGMQSEVRPGQSSLNVAVGNGTNNDGSRMATHQNKGTTNGRHNMNFGGKSQGRDNNAAVSSRRQ